MAVKRLLLNFLWWLSRKHNEYISSPYAPRWQSWLVDRIWKIAFVGYKIL